MESDPLYARLFKGSDPLLPRAEPDMDRSFNVVVIDKDVDGCII